MSIFKFFNLKITIYFISMTSKIVTKTTAERLVKDIKEIMRSNLSKDRIYYKHDDSNMLLGHALIIGPDNTPYANGFFLFRLHFPCDYPYSPPKLEYLTNDGRTRFHPNFYKNQKVCVSLLNTWKGEQWTSCQTIRSILITLQSLMDDKPLLNEPGITEQHIDFNVYNQIVTYKTLEVAIGKVIAKELFVEEYNIFWSDIVDNFIKNYNNIIEKLPNTKDDIITCGIYRMQLKTSYKKLNDLFTKFYKEYK